MTAEEIADLIMRTAHVKDYQMVTGRELRDFMVQAATMGKQQGRDR